MIDLPVDTLNPMEAFSYFLRGFRNDDGSFKYKGLIQQMIAEKEVSLQVNFIDLIRFNPELARRTMDESKDFIEAGNQALAKLVRFLDRSFASTKKNFFIRFYNLPENDLFSVMDLSFEQERKLITVKGLVHKTTKLGFLYNSKSEIVIFLFFLLFLVVAGVVVLPVPASPAGLGRG